MHHHTHSSIHTHTVLDMRKLREVNLLKTISLVVHLRSPDSNINNLTPKLTLYYQTPPITAESCHRRKS